MEKEKSKFSGSSSSSSNRGRTRVPGIPEKCWCGSGIVQRISGTDENPCRRYYRCAYAAAYKLRYDPHVFKWVDEAFGDEIGLMEYQIGVLDEEVTVLKARRTVVDGVEFEKEFDNLKNEIIETVEAGLMETKRSMKWMMALVLGACVLLVILGILVKK